MELLRFVRDVAIGQKSGPIDGDFAGRDLFRRALFQSLDRLLQQPCVGIEADCVHETGLLCAEDVSGAAQLEILERNGVPAAEVREVFEDAESALGLFLHVLRNHEITIRAMV